MVNFLTLTLRRTDMDYKDLAMELAIWPWIDDDLAGAEDLWDDYDD